MKKKHKISFCLEKEGCLFFHSSKHLEALKAFEICKTESSFSDHTSECKTKYNRLVTFLRLKIQHAARQEKRLLYVKQASCSAEQVKKYKCILIHFSSIRITLWHSVVLY